MRGLLKTAAQQPDVSNVHILKSLDAVENLSTCEHKDVDDNTNKKQGQEETHIQGPSKAVPKTKKSALKFEGKKTH